jgi:hypothetical protein
LDTPLNSIGHDSEENIVIIDSEGVTQNTKRLARGYMIDDYNYIGGGGN